MNSIHQPKGKELAGRMKKKEEVDINIAKIVGGIHWQSSGKDLCFHCRGHGFSPWWG